MLLVFSLGSNMGNRTQNLLNAYEQLRTIFRPIVLRSSIYESEPWGVENQNNYYNSVVAFESDQTIEEIKTAIPQIEQKLGREYSSQRWHSRIIDIDLIYYGEEIFVTRDFHIPHKRMHLRKFVLLPLCEILPEMIHPVFQKTSTELLKNCPDLSEVKRLADAGE